MIPRSISLVVRKDTTSAKIDSFLQEAGERLSRLDAGVRARQGVGADGQFDGTTVLYMRILSTPGTAGEFIASFIDSVKASFNANEEYKLAVQTLLERAQIASRNETEFADGSSLCPAITRVLAGRNKRLTLKTTQDAWRAAFTVGARKQSNAILTTLRKDIAERKGLPGSKQENNRKQKNGQAPKVVFENGMADLSFLDALLSVPVESLGRPEKMHLKALLAYLGLSMKDDDTIRLI